MAEQVETIELYSSDVPELTTAEKIDAIYKKMCFIESQLAGMAAKVQEGGILGLLSGIGRR